MAAWVYFHASPTVFNLLVRTNVVAIVWKFAEITVETTMHCVVSFWISLTYNIGLVSYLFLHKWIIDSILIYVVYIYISIYLDSLHIRQLYHSTYKLYLSSLFFEYLALLVQIAYWASYARFGLSRLTLKNLGEYII